MTTYAIFGAGSIGCYVGGKLAAGGKSVIFIGREKLADTVSKNGLVLTDYEQSKDVLTPDNIRFETSPASLAEADVILVCVKSMASAEAAAEIATHAKPEAVVISLQNGVSNADTLKAGVRGQSVAGGMVPYNVVNLGDGRFHKGTPGDLIVEVLPETASIIVEMAEAGLATQATDNIKGVLWGKLLINLNNALNLLSDKPLKQELLDVNFRRVWGLCIKEGLAVLKAADIRPVKSGPLDPAFFARILSLPNFILMRIAPAFNKIDDNARSSMWEDLQAGRAPEIDYINGAIVALGQELNVPTPVNDRIIHMVKEAFAQQKSPALSGRQVLDRVS
ncbi:MAG: 2-dehydropantoate 2-reductase [Aquisalinus sp.]|nr:2-dehydropantoate 2-reductase [Aquisalinus sp.]